MPAPRQAIQIPSEVRPFGLGAFFGLLLRAVVAYVTGFALYVAVFRISRRMDPAIFADEGMRNLGLFLLIGLIVATLLLALFQPMWSSEARGFGLMTSFTLIAIAFAQAAGVTHIDAAAPLDVLVREHLNALNLGRR